jgi:ribonucleoside-diphosphate reductase alpha chain
MPRERQSITHKFSVGGHEGYLTVGLYPDGEPGEIFLTMASTGDMERGFAECFAISVSMLLQEGVPLERLASKFTHITFDPRGYTSNKAIPRATSIVDYVFQYLMNKFLSPAPPRNSK